MEDPAVTCAKCATELKPLGSPFSSRRATGVVTVAKKSSFLRRLLSRGGRDKIRSFVQQTEMWNGVVCAHCRAVYCTECNRSDSGLTVSSVCRACGHDVVPATRRALALLE